MVLRNLAIVSASAGDFNIAQAYAADFINERFFADAFHSALAIRQFGGEEQCVQADSIIANLATSGHIRSQIEQRSRKPLNSNIFHRFSFLFYRIFKGLHAMLLVARNPQDPRASM